MSIHRGNVIDADSMINVRLAGDHVLDHVTRTIVEHLQPRRIVLFGSRARGDSDAESDYDIMVEIDADVASSARAVYDLFPRQPWSMDVLVYTAEEVRRWKDDVGFVLYDIVREGRVLYCRPDVGDDFWPVITAPVPRVREGLPESLASWIDRAREDFVAMEATAGLEPPVHGVVCFHAHQCAEKLLEACLISRSIRPPRTHNVHTLLDLCVQAGFDLMQLRSRCQTLYDVWLKTRYPAHAGPTTSEAQAAVEAATDVRRVVLPLLEQRCAAPR